MPLADAGDTKDFTAKDGMAWTYAGQGTPAAAATPNPGMQLWYITAYAANGAPVAERWPEPMKRGEEDRTGEDLLNSVMDDLRQQ